MLIKELPGSGGFADRYPNFSELTLRKAAKTAARLLFEPRFRRQIQQQKLVTEQLVQQIEIIDLADPKKIVQVGANDGKRDDPIEGVLASKQAGAILVEPMPIAFEALTKRYANRPNTQLVRGAISQKGGDIPLYVPVVPGHELHSSLWACSTREQAAGEGRRFLGSGALEDIEVASVAVHSQSAGQLLEDCGVSPENVAVLVCDTEGQDTEVVRSFLDAGAQPEVIFYEQLHVPAIPALEFKAHLGDLGYNIAETNKDVLATLPV